MKFNIKLPDLEINKEQRDLEIRSLLSADFERGGILNQCLVFTYLNHVASTTEIMEKLSRYYQREFDRSAVFRALQRLNKIGLVFTKTSGDVVMMQNNEMSDIDKSIMVKYKKFLEKIPDPFRRRYSDVNYFWLSNGRGLEFIPFSCKILNFECAQE